MYKVGNVCEWPECGRKRTTFKNWFSSNMWILGTELRSSSLATSALPTVLSHQYSSNQFLFIML